MSRRIEILQRRLNVSSLWRERLRSAGYYPFDPITDADVPLLPELTRDDLNSRLSELLAVACDRDLDGFSWVWSSGSTGPALRVPRTETDRRDRWRVHVAASLAHGLDLSAFSRGVFLCTRPGSVGYSTWGDPERRMRIRRLPLTEADWWGSIETEWPQIVFLSPDGLELLLEADLRIRPRVIISTALHLRRGLRAEVRGRWGAVLINLISTAETGPFAWECPRHHGIFHVFEDLYRVDTDRSGHLRVSRFTDSILPILNYRLDDIARVSNGACDCGANGSRIEDFMGRTRKGDRGAVKIG